MVIIKSVNYAILHKFKRNPILTETHELLYLFWHEKSFLLLSLIIGMFKKIKYFPVTLLTKKKLCNNTKPQYRE